MRYAVISNDPKAFLLGRYQTLEDAEKAIGGRLDLWCLYQLVKNQEVNDGIRILRTVGMATDGTHA